MPNFAVLLQVDGRLLQEPKVMYGKCPANIGMGAWNLRGMEFIEGATLESFAVCSFLDTARYALPVRITCPLLASA